MFALQLPCAGIVGGQSGVNWWLSCNYVCEGVIQMRIPHFLLLAILLVACQQALPTPAPALTAVPPTTVAIVTATPTDQPPSNTATPSPTAVPTKTATATATATYTPLPTGTPSPTATSPALPAPAETLAPDVWAGIGTPMPPNSAVISTENISQIAQLGHWGKGRILTAAYTPDGTQLIALTAEGVYWYDAATAEQTAVQRYNRPLVNMALSPDGQLLALAYETSGGGPSYVEVRRTADNELVSAFYIHILEHSLLQFNELWFTADSETLISASGELHEIGAWRIGDGSFVGSIDFETNWLVRTSYTPEANLLAVHEGATISYWSLAETGWAANGQITPPETYQEQGLIALSRDGELLVVTKPFTIGQAVVLNRTDGQILYELSADERRRLSKLPALSGPGRGNIESISFSLDGQLLALATSNLGVTIWRTADGELTQSWQDVGDQVYFAPDGTTVATGRDSLAQWRVADASFVNVLNQHIGTIYALAFVPNQPYLAIGAGDGFVYMRHLRDGGLMTSLRASRSNTASYSYPSVVDLDFSADGQTLVTAADDAVRVWNMTDYSFTTLSPRLEVGGSAVTISPNGRYVAMSQHDDLTYLWDLEQPNSHQKFWEGCYSAESLAFVTTQEFLLVCAERLAVTLWSDSTQVWLELPNERLVADAVALSPDSQFLAMGIYGGHLEIWQFEGEQYEFVLETASATIPEHDYLRQVIFSPDNQLLIGLSQAKAFVWEVVTGELLHTWPVDRWGYSRSPLAISPDGRWLAIGTSEGIVQLWGIPQ